LDKEQQTGSSQAQKARVMKDLGRVKNQLAAKRQCSGKKSFKPAAQDRKGDRWTSECGEKRANGDIKKKSSSEQSREQEFRKENKTSAGPRESTLTGETFRTEADLK